MVRKQKCDRWKVDGWENQPDWLDRIVSVQTFSLYNHVCDQARQLQICNDKGGL
jgi:hypothetical protein